MRASCFSSPAGGEGLRPQVADPRGSEDGPQRETLPPAGCRGDPHPGAPEKAGQGLEHERHPHAGELHFPKPHLHDLRAAQHEPVRAHQEEQVPGLQPPAGQEVRPLHPAVSGLAAQEPHHPLRPQAREHFTEAAGTQWHQGETEKFTCCFCLLSSNSQGLLIQLKILLSVSLSLFRS